MLDTNIEASQVAAVVRAQFPEIAAAHVEHLGEGYDSTAFDVDGRWVFRFPKRADVEQQLLLEMRVLPVLSRHSPLALPEFCFHGRPSAEFPRHFVGYPKLAGVPAISIEPTAARFARWALPLGRFLSWLHTFPLDEMMACGVKLAHDSELVDEVRADALDDLENVHRVAPGAQIGRWRTYLASPPQSPDRNMFVLVHRDLAAEHVMCDADSTAITGVIDWSEIAIDDRAADLAALFHWGGPSFADAALASYTCVVDAGTLARARYLAACRGASDVTFGLETGRPEYLRSGIAALRSCIG